MLFFLITQLLKCSYYVGLIRNLQDSVPRILKELNREICFNWLSSSNTIMYTMRIMDPHYDCFIKVTHSQIILAVSRH